MQTAIATILAVGGAMLVSPSWAQNDPNNEIMKIIYTKMMDQIQPKRSTLDEGSNQYMFVMTQPGIFIDPRLLDDSGKEDIAQKRIFSEIVDRIMIPSWVYGPKDETYYEYYKLILDSYDYKPLPLPDNKAAELHEAEAALFSGEVDADGVPKPTKDYATFLALKEKHLTALGEAQEWLNKNPGASQYPPSVASKVQNAMNAWLTAGKKTKFETYLENVRRYNAAGFWAEAAITFNRTGENVSLHSYYPSIATWLKKENAWPSITIGWSKNETHNLNRQTSASGGGSFSLGGFYSVGGGANYDRVKNIAQNEATKIDIKFEYLRVDFRRPWLTRRPFSDQRWRFACGTEPEVKKQIVSTGPKADAGNAVQYPGGVMPMIPTGFLIVRNATVTGNFQKNFKEYFKETLSASASGGFGPFRVRGSYNDTTEKTDIEATTADNGFTVGHPQIIGFFAEVLPLSPNPQAGLFEPCVAKP